MATLLSLADRLRLELGDMGKSFVWQTVADGLTNRFLVPYSPINGTTLTVSVGGADVSTACEVEESTGYITFDVLPEEGDSIIVAGTYYRYFTDAEICSYVETAFGQHVANHADGYGRGYTMMSLPGLEEYPVVVYASTLALYTLATDASFDIDIQAPDGVMIPRSERYRQLMQMIDVRKNQYKEICSQLGIGLYKIDVFSLRRISKTTNHYVPIYLPQEIDDRSSMKRAIIPMPSYGSAVAPSDVPTYDLTMYQGDSFEVELDFPFDVGGYVWRADIARQAGGLYTLASFDIEQIDTQKLKLSLTALQTEALPDKAVWDIQATIDGDSSYQKTYMRGGVFVTREVTQ